MLTGNLTIRAVTRPVEFEVEFLGIDATGLQGETVPAPLPLELVGARSFACGVVVHIYRPRSR